MSHKHDWVKRSKTTSAGTFYQYVCRCGKKDTYEFTPSSYSMRSKEPANGSRPVQKEV